jgi:hypothetical protein
MHCFMRCLIKILFNLLLFSNLKAQLLFYQDTYKGGITSDGRSYEGFDCLQNNVLFRKSPAMFY